MPVLDSNGNSKLQDVERECEVDIALRWGIGYETKVNTFVNIIATPKGGSHLAGFEQGLLKTFRKHLADNARKYKMGNDKIEKDDVLAGLTAVLTVRLAEPQFRARRKRFWVHRQSAPLSQRLFQGNLPQSSSQLLAPRKLRLTL